MRANQCFIPTIGAHCDYAVNQHTVGFSPDRPDLNYSLANSNHYLINIRYPNQSSYSLYSVLISE